MALLLTTLANIKAHVRMAGSNADALLTLIGAASESWVAERICAAFKVEEVEAERIDGGGELLRVLRRPLVAVSEIVDAFDGEVIPEEDYEIDGDAIRVVPTGSSNPVWGCGRTRWKVTYTGGFNNGNDPVPDGSIAAPVGLELVVLNLTKRQWMIGEGVVSSGSQGLNASFDKLFGGEIDAMLSPYIRGGFIA